MSLLAMVVMVVAFSMTVNSQITPVGLHAEATYCLPSLSGLEIKCKKRDYKQDTVVINNISGRRVTFKISEWESLCNTPGRNYANRIDSLGKGENATYIFRDTFRSSPSLTSVGELLKTLIGRCNEFVIHSCSTRLCTIALDVYAKD